jgi:hypothetical protein
LYFLPVKIVGFNRNQTLSDQNHLFCLLKSGRLQPIYVNSGADLLTVVSQSIPAKFIAAGIELMVFDRFYMTTVD